MSRSGPDILGQARRASSCGPSDSKLRWGGGFRQVDALESGDRHAALGIVRSIDSGTHHPEGHPRRRRGPGTSLPLGGVPLDASAGGWIPRVGRLLGEHAKLLKHARIGVQSLHVGVIPLSQRCMQSVHVSGEDSHRMALHRGCVIRPEDHNGPVPTHRSHPCSQSRGR